MFRYIVFISISKNWDFFGNLGVHIGANKNIWEKTGVPDDDDQINLFFGIDKELNRSFSLIFECDAALNDNQDKYEIEDLAFGRELEVEETLGFLCKEAVSFGLDCPCLQMSYNIVSGVNHIQKSLKN